ncbi:MAG: hypothetical protein IPL84_13995 [Chitinophagaceae bacterium]|nr:hypothetical protein [Chitinophagaceae bacterium]
MKYTKYVSLLILTGSLQACNFAVDGGPCTYETTIYPATLVELVEINSASYELLFEVVVSEKKDTLRYSAINNGNYLFYADLPKDSLLMGKQYQYQVQRIQKGTCAPMVDIIKLSAYTSPH